MSAGPGAGRSADGQPVDGTDHPVLGDLQRADQQSGERAGRGAGLPLTEVAADVVDLAEAGQELLDKARSSGTGRAVRAVLRQPGQQSILLAFPASGGLPDHDAPGPASLHCLTGRVRLIAGEQTWQFGPGQAVTIPDATHSVVADEESTCLLVVSRG